MRRELRYDNDDNANFIAWWQINNDDANDYQPIWQSSKTKYSGRQFLKDITTDTKQHWIIRILNFFLYGAMLITDWLERKINKKRKGEKQ